MKIIGSQLEAGEGLMAQAAKFKVTEMMLECVDDYMRPDRGNGSNEEARIGLRYHYPKLTEAQIEKVLKVWHTQTEAK
jgi:hypothetical protein